MHTNSLWADNNSSSLPKKEVSNAAILKTALTKNITYLLFFAYTLLLLQPILPILADVAAHTFWPTEHLLVVHEVNGKFHVHQELKKANKQSEKDKTTRSVKFEVSECVFIHVEAVYRVLNYINKKAYSYYNISYPFSYLDIHYPPPKYCSSTI